MASGKTNNHQVVIALDVAQNTATVYVDCKKCHVKQQNIHNPAKYTCQVHHVLIRNSRGRESGGWMCSLQRRDRQKQQSQRKNHITMTICSLWRLMHNGPPIVMVDHRRVSRITVCVKRRHDTIVSKGLPVGFNALIVNPRHCIRDVFEKETNSWAKNDLGYMPQQRQFIDGETIGAVVSRMEKRLDAWHATGSSFSFETTAVMACDIVTTVYAYNTTVA